MNPPHSPDQSSDAELISKLELIIEAIATKYDENRSTDSDYFVNQIMRLIRSEREKAQLEARINELEQLYEAAYKVATQQGTDFRELAQAYDDQINNRLKELRKETK